MNRVAKVDLHLQARADCPSNLILLSDLVTVHGSDALVQQIVDVPLAPAPRMGIEQTWTRADIEKSLTLRGISNEAIRWHGASECKLRRVEGRRTEKDNNKTQDEGNSGKAPIVAKLVGRQEQVVENNLVPQTNTETYHSFDKSQFTTPFTTPTTVSQAERIAGLAIEDYLRAKTDSTGRWIVKVHMPTEHAKIFSQRRQILGIAGGQPPWEGKQEFVFLIKGQNGEQSIAIPATVKLPEMVFAANRPLSKGYVLREEDLAWIAMPRGLAYGPEDCFSETEALVGKQLRRAMSTQQVIRSNEVGPPMVIHVGDLVGIGIVSGGVTVETNGRAIEPGGIDDLIQVEVQPHRKRLLARITGERTVEVISNAAAYAQAPIKNQNTTNKSNQR